MSYPLALLNTTIATANDGVFSLKSLTIQEAKDLMAKNAGNTISHVGHEATAEKMSVLFGTHIPVSRAPLAQAVGQQALCFKFRQRLEEGKVLTSQAEIEDVGYDFVLMTRTA